MASAKAVPEDLSLSAVEIRWKSVSIEVWLYFIAVSSGLIMLKSRFSLGGGGGGGERINIYWRAPNLTYD